MSRIALTGGAYWTRSPIASAIRSINYFPERNPEGSPVPFTYYQAPGRIPLVTGPTPGPVRGLWRSSNGLGYTVIGQIVYSLGGPPGWTLTQLGTLATKSSTPVSFVDNGVEILLVDGSSQGYQIILPTSASIANGTANQFSVVDDTSGNFVGATRVDTLDTFILWNRIGTNQFGSTLSNQITPGDALYFAAKTSYPDPLQTLIVNRREILLLGQVRSEIWYNAGNQGFPFAELPGAYIEQGIVAPYSVCWDDTQVIWLSQNIQGQGIVVTQKGYQTARLSNYALEFAIRKMAKAGTITDCIGWCYQQDGHRFAVLTFPSGDETWVCDLDEPNPMLAWHQRAWTDSNGILHRVREMSSANLYGQIVVGDQENGTIYALDLDTYTDTLVVDGTPGPMTFIKGFPHSTGGVPPGGALPLDQILPGNGHEIQFRDFRADFECGAAPLDVNGNPAVVSLRWSDDRGRTWGNAVLQSAGAPGEYLTQPQWGNTGSARYRVFEIGHSIAGPAALNGAWVQAQVLVK